MNRGASPELLTWVDQVVAVPGGFIGSMAELDLESGRQGSALFRLDSARPAQRVGPDGPDMARILGRIARAPGADVVAHGSLLVAAACTPALRPLVGGIVQAAGGRDQPLGPVVVAWSRAWVLVGTADGLSPTTQRILQTDLADVAAGTVRDLDLAALNLSAVRRITLIARYADSLAVAVADAVRGFDLYRLAAAGTLEPVLTEGARRFALNAAVSAVASHGDGGLLLGVAALAPAEELTGSWGPELIALEPDGSWDLVFGAMRFAPGGMAVPISGMKPGLDNPANAAIRAIAVGRVGGRLLTCIAMQDHVGPPVQDRRQVTADLMAYRGTVRLYGSHDLQDWFAIPVSLPAGSGCVTVLGVSDQGLLIGHEGSQAGQVPALLVRP